MAIFNSYVKLPEGILYYDMFHHSYNGCTPEGRLPPTSQLQPGTILVMPSPATQNESIPKMNKLQPKNLEKWSVLYIF